MLYDVVQPGEREAVVLIDRGAANIASKDGETTSCGKTTWNVPASMDERVCGGDDIARATLLE
jgi:hypothetical protein